MKQRGSKAAAVVVSSVGAAMLFGGTAVAFWSTTGTGTGTGTSGTSQELVVAPTSPVSGLYPGATLAGGAVSVSNPNAFDVTITDKGFGAVKVDDAHSACTTLNVITFGFGAAQPTVVPAGKSVSVPFTVAMAASAVNACQGATFTSPLTVVAQSV